MNKQELKELETDGVFMGIDTIEVKSETPTPYNNIDKTYVRKIEKRDINTNSFTYILNPDTANSNVPIYDSNTYYSVSDYMINSLELTAPIKTRIDFRFDCFNENYEKYAKLNKLLILLIANKYNLNNRYESIDPLLLKPLTVRAQNTRLEIENYNKSFASPNDIVKNRLEFRSKQLYDNRNENVKEYNEFKKWCERIQESTTPENYKSVQDNINTALYNNYLKEQQEIKCFSINEFLHEYRNSIFTSKQLSDLYKCIGYKDPEQSAKKYIKRKGIILFSLKDLIMYTDILLNSGDRFFG
ncbi:MAG: hypothetical protein MRZ61_00495 [Oscillospiraceae bacterium]|nr:hypothetical protein [Oscillospiraceae bacterium]